MKPRVILAIWVCCILVISACTKDRIPEPVDITDPLPLPDDSLFVERHTLFINEFVARASIHINEFGSAEDWIEVFNPAFTPIALVAGRWFISDAGLANPTKYELPQLTIPARGYVLIWADNMDVVAQDIHTNFALSASGEHIVIYYKLDDETGILVDDYAYGQQQPAVSEGRFPDGGEVWAFFPEPTPGAPNM